MINEKYQDILNNYIIRGSTLEKVIKQSIKKPQKMISLAVLRTLNKISKKGIRKKIKLFTGDEMTVILPEIVSSSIFAFSYFEEDLTNIVLKYLKPGNTFLDVGAHIGYFTLLGSLLVGESGRVHSFEPTPSTFNLLQLNVKSNKRCRNNVILNNCAVFSRETDLSFNDYGIEYSAFNSFVNARLNKNSLDQINVNKFKVKTISLDKYIFDNRLKPNFIKIDAESAEYEILKGMKRTLEKIKPIITIEVGDMEIEDIENSSVCIEYILDRGYNSYEYKNGHIIRHKLKDEYTYDNILFLPI